MVVVFVVMAVIIVVVVHYLFSFLSRTSFPFTSTSLSHCCISLLVVILHIISWTAFCYGVFTVFGTVSANNITKEKKISKKSSYGHYGLNLKNLQIRK